MTLAQFNTDDTRWTAVCDTSSDADGATNIEITTNKRADISFVIYRFTFNRGEAECVESG